MRNDKGKIFRLGHILSVFLGYGISAGKDSFLLDPILSFMFGVPVDRSDFPAATTACRDELLRQFDQFRSEEFLFEMSRLSVAVRYLPENRDPMPIVSVWYAEQLRRYGDSFRVFPIRSAFCFLSGAESDLVAEWTAGQNFRMN